MPENNNNISWSSEFNKKFNLIRIHYTRSNCRFPPKNASISHIIASTGLFIVVINKPQLAKSLTLLVLDFIPK